MIRALVLYRVVDDSARLLVGEVAVRERLVLVENFSVGLVLDVLIRGALVDGDGVLEPKNIFGTLDLRE